MFLDLRWKGHNYFLYFLSWSFYFFRISSDRNWKFFLQLFLARNAQFFRNVLYLTLRFLPRWTSEDHEFPHYLDICKWFGLQFVVKLMLTDSFLILFMNELSKSRSNYRVHWTLVINIEKMYYGNTKHAHNFFQISIRITIFFLRGVMFFCFVLLFC